MIEPNSADAAVAAYEELRSQVLAGAPRGGRFGLVLLLREGGTSAAGPDPAVSTPLVSQQLHAGIVSVLANIAQHHLTDREGMNL
ncbi:MAG: hypothetical protein DMG09_18560 [Acidobacteria bacterium]|nr:MAG: hypothetical protein DMG09_18560 [Acidobacteriota bacterium]